MISKQFVSILHGASVLVTVRGDFDPDKNRAVLHFSIANGLTATGYGPVAFRNPWNSAEILEEIFHRSMANKVTSNAADGQLSFL